MKTPPPSNAPSRLELTPATMEQVRNNQQRFFQQNNTQSFAFRDQQLQRLGEAISKRERQFLEALQADLGKSQAEAFVTEIGFVYKEIRYARKNLRRWMRPQKVFTNLLVAPARCRIVTQPKGQVLIIGPWNYPLQLLISPLIGALAAGNTVVLKPSEVSVHTSALIMEMIHETFSQDIIAVFQGGPDVSQALLSYPWDHVFFTGSTNVGRIVARAAAASLSPYTLELGGKSPCIVDQDASLSLAARRIVWGKFTNAGQTCVAPDFVWVHRKVKASFLSALKVEIQKRYGDNPRLSTDYGRIISEQHTARLVKFLSDGNPVIGGAFDISERYVAPTVLDQVSMASNVMKEEIFGPILPVLDFEQISDIESHLQSQDKPLALYYFGRNHDTMQRLEKHALYGGGCFNDTVMHLAHQGLPFGGVGASGTGAYHGHESYKVFSHHKSLIHQSTLVDMPVRYPPYRGWQRWLMRVLLRL